MKKKLIDKLSPKIYLKLKHNYFRLVSKSDYRQMQEQRKIVTEMGYSFKPFDDTKSIFIHIPKCAGVSVCRALYGNLAGGHTNFDRYIQAFEPEKILTYFKFTFVRNPWDRLVSSFHFLKQGGFNESDRAWADRELAEYQDFDSFVKGWLNQENIYKWWHFIPQHVFILEGNNKITLDFIGRVETIEKDFGFVADKLGCEAAVELLNKSSRSRYQDYYSDETRKIVYQVYQKDIELLNYSFEG